MSAETFSQDVAAVQQIDVVPRILEVVCRTTGMSFAAVARVTEQRWIACAVRDGLGLGLLPGGEIDVNTTVCNEIRTSRQSVAIDHAAADPRFCAHHAAEMYGFQSYISVPLCRPDGSFFGTLCALDAKPAQVNNAATIDMLSLFADLIGCHLDAQDRLRTCQSPPFDGVQNRELRDHVVAVLGQELAPPLGLIRSSTTALTSAPLTESAQQNVNQINRSVARLTTLIDGLLDFIRAEHRTTGPSAPR